MKTPWVEASEMLPRRPGWYFVRYEDSGDSSYDIVEWPEKKKEWHSVTDWQELPGLSWPLSSQPAP